MKRVINTVAIFSFLFAFTAKAFNPPTDTRNDLTFEILGVNKEEPTTQPLTFTVKLTNKSHSNTTGQVKVWLNDDWHVDGTPQRN